MSNSAFNQSQTGNATELGAGSVKLATQQQIDDRDADDGGVPLVATPDKLPTGIWKLVRTFVNPVQQNTVDIIDLGGYQELIIISAPSNIGRPDSSAATALAYVSTDNGVTFLSTDKYIAGPTSATGDSIFIGTNPTSGAYIFLHFHFWNSTLPFKPIANLANSSSTYSSSVVTELPLNAIRFTVSGTYYFLAGATFYIYGKQ